MKAFRRWIPCALFGFAVVVIEFALVVVKGRPVELLCCIRIGHGGVVETLTSCPFGQL